MNVRRRGEMPWLPALAWPCLLCLLFAALLSGRAWAQDTEMKIDPAAARAYQTLGGAVQASRLQATVAALSGIHYAVPGAPGGPGVTAYSRLAGTAGGRQAQAYVQGQFQAIFGAGNVSVEEFPVTTPTDNGASVTANGRAFALQPLWPNLVRTSTLPERGIDGPLIYAGGGDLRAFRGKQVEGSIVLLDFNCGTQWLNAARLGAKAILFVAPTHTMRGEAEAKFIGIPVAIPRFLVSRADAGVLQSSALTIPNFTVHVASDNPWQVSRAANIIGKIPGTDPVLGRQVVVVESYYDSMSVVPTQAPGAEAACGIASLLEVARAFKANPPKRTVWFVAGGAHFLGLQSARIYIDKHLEEWQDYSAWDRLKASLTRRALPPTSQVMLFTGLDLSSQTGSVGGFYKGYFYDYREDIQGDFSDLGRYLHDNAQKAGQTLGFDGDQAFADGINPTGGKSWRNYLPGHFAFDAEVATLAGGKGLTFATTDDARQTMDTPLDTASNVNIANLVQQTRLLTCQYWNLFNDTNDPNQVPQNSAKGLMPVSQWPAWSRQGLRLGFSRLTGRALLFDPKKNFVPDTPIPDSLVVIDNLAKTSVGVRGNLVQGTDDGSAGHPASHSLRTSRFEFVGLPLVISGGQGLRLGASGAIGVEAYHLRAHDTPEGGRGDVDYAPDSGVNGAVNYPLAFPLTSDRKATEVILFPCVATTIFDLVDPQALQPLTGIRIFDGASDGEPRQYGYDLNGDAPGVHDITDVAVLYSAPGAATRLKVVMDSGPGATRFLLINSLPSNPRLPKSVNQRNAQGIGYAVSAPSALGNSNQPPDPNNPNDIVRNGAITNTALHVAEDMWNLDEFRLQQLAKYRIVALHNPNDPVTGLHDIAEDYIKRAQKAYAARDYDAFDSFSRQAWAFEARVYPQAQQTANDVVQGVIFYLFLLIPFAYFVERLFFGYADLKKQLLAVFVIFSTIFFIFSQIHPAFDITINPLIVLIAFIMLALSIGVSLLVWSKFEEQLKEFNKSVSGVHKADVGKASIAFAAFGLGISNMRRRKERTLLTCITLILLTFTVLSFTSIVNTIRKNDVSAPGTVTYNGILLHLPTWDPLQEPAYRLLNDEYGRQYPVAPRAWYFGTTQGQQAFLHVGRADLGSDVKAVAGFSPAEAGVTHLDTTLETGPDGKPVGRWFNASDTYSILLPKAIADTLNVGPADVAKGVTVSFSGVRYQVIGIIDSGKFKLIKDLDNEILTPVDFISQSQQSAPSGGSSGSSGGGGFQEYLHLDPDNVVYIPYQTLINMGGDLRSVAINFGTGQEVKTQLGSLIPRLDLNLYAGGASAAVVDGKNHRVSSIGATSSQGLVNIIIPILIASLIVLNTMLGSVFERVKEIAIFSSIGLSPGNIAMLFIAEALVYAIIGAVSGYLIGQALSKIISVFHILPGLYLNFSSTSAEVAIGLVIGVVLLSTIFPAKKASEVATPSVDRTWRLPDPDGDTWRITLPFAVSGAQAPGINSFLTEWFQSYEEQSVGDFLTQGIGSRRVAMTLGEGYRLTGRIWLAPFDLGVSQDIALDTAPTDLEDVYAVDITLTRVSGDVSNWKRVNRRFLNVVRKQFLIWRTLTAEERERYLEIMPTAETTITEPDAAAVAPAL